MNSFYKGERCIIVDESGNLGVSGRYFVIAAIDTNNYKSLHNMMHKKLGIARTTFPALAVNHTHEIKAVEAYPAVKYHLLECIARKELSIAYIVIDLHHVDPPLLAEKNIFYNYALRLLLDRMIGKKFSGKLNIICDNKTNKVGSANSLEDYLKIHYIFDLKRDYNINVIYMDSNSATAYPVQAADYVANAIYGNYEFGDDQYMKLIKTKIKSFVHFPYTNFSH